ncbi:hypothetical protein A3765_00975 [Oleiphilus sp. HI0130]|nr:hypothetical protein A3765_00975 [Oleiphilus sp. HI0130]
MSYAQRYVITFNGEIYNYLELKEELQAQGYSFVSATDTEVILAAFDFWGTDCLQHFNGMWAFAILDKAKNTVFCARDRFGVKPFFYTQTCKKFMFCSEIKQVLPLIGEKRHNKQAILDFLVCGLSEHTKETFFEGVYNLPGGYSLTYQLETNEFHVERWYELSVEPKAKLMDESAALDQYTNEFVRSVAYRMRSDVEVGTCLSGGLDSSSVASVAASISHLDRKHRFKAIHARSSEERFDESHHAQRVAEHCDINLSVIEPSFDDFAHCFDDLVYMQDEPFSNPSVLMQYFVMKKAKELGCKVMLDGQGGDESLLGYERYYAAYIQSLPIRKKLHGLVGAQKNSGLSTFKVLAFSFYFTRGWARKFVLRRKHSYLKSSLLRDLPWVDKLASSYKDIEKLQRLEVFYSQMPHLLRYEDRNSMAHSIEARLPFLDYQLLEASVSMDEQYKVKEGYTKYILRVAMQKFLPASIVWRKNKLGFNAPDKTWISQHRLVMGNQIKASPILQSMLKDFSKIERCNDKIFFKLFCIAKWEAIFDVS